MAGPDYTIVLFGAAGLVGQNLVVLLKQHGFTRLVCIDKHPANTAILRRLHPELTLIEGDIAGPSLWEAACTNAAAAVVLQAQIGGEGEVAFHRNNVVATERVFGCENSLAVSTIGRALVASQGLAWPYGAGLLTRKANAGTDSRVR